MLYDYSLLVFPCGILGFKPRRLLPQGLGFPSPIHICLHSLWGCMRTCWSKSIHPLSTNNADDALDILLFFAFCSVSTSKMHICWPFLVQDCDALWFTGEIHASRLHQCFLWKRSPPLCGCSWYITFSYCLLRIHIRDAFVDLLLYKTVRIKSTVEYC